MLMSLGSLAFEVAPFNAHSLEFSADTDYAAKPVVGAEPDLEFVGNGAHSWTINGRLFPAKFGGLDALERLHELRTSGQPQYLMRGDGKPLGWVAITNVTESSTYLDRHGVGKMIEVTISVRRTKAPANQKFPAVMQSIG